ELGCMEAQHLRFAKASDHPTVVRAGERMRGVEQQGQVELSRDLYESVDIAGAAPEVNSDDAGGAWRDHLTGPARIEGGGFRIDVGEQRGELLALQRMGRGDEGERRYDHLAGKAAGADSKLQCNRTVAGGDTVSHPEQVGDAPFQLDDVWPVVRVP